jgi:hypothetical protein
VTLSSNQTPCGEQTSRAAGLGKIPQAGVEKDRPGAKRARMMDVLSALIPVVVVGGAVIYGVVKLLRSDAAGLRSRSEPSDKDENSSS